MNEYICNFHLEEPDGYKLSLDFNSMEHAKHAALEILEFLGLLYPSDAGKETASEEDAADSETECAAVNHAPVKSLEDALKTPLPFRDLLTTFRSDHGYSQRKMASVLGVTQSTVSAWERGIINPCEETERKVRARLEAKEEAMYRWFSDD